MTATHTPSPWIWWTSNSWRRLKRDNRGITANVLEPYVCRDGHPDVTVSAADMALIAAGPDLLEALKASLEGHYMTWMAARAEVEGAKLSAKLFEKEPEVIKARTAIAKATTPWPP